MAGSPETERDLLAGLPLRDEDEVERMRARLAAVMAEVHAYDAGQKSTKG